MQEILVVVLLSFNAIISAWLIAQFFLSKDSPKPSVVLHKPDSFDDQTGLFAWRHVVCIKKDPNNSDGCIVTMSTGLDLILPSHSSSSMMARFANAHLMGDVAFTLTRPLTSVVVKTKVEVQE